MHTTGNDNSGATGCRGRNRLQWRTEGRDEPLTTGGRDVVLPPLMASLERESDEGMWYASSTCFDTNPRLPPQL
jgi:hypothetical protein